MYQVRSRLRGLPAVGRQESRTKRLDLIVRSTKYQVPSSFRTRIVLHTLYFVLGSVPHFFILQSAFGVRHYPPRRASSQYQDFIVLGTKYNVQSRLRSLPAEGRQEPRTKRLDLIVRSTSILLHTWYFACLPQAGTSYLALRI